MASFRYVLRYFIAPGYEEEERIEELVQFCRDSHIEEVMLFTFAEELSDGHITTDELKDFIRMAKRLKQRLDENNIALSLNPWTTLYHTARGRTLKPGQDFTLLVREDGTDNGITACPLCPNWLRYITETYCELAREIRPVAIWIEDDYRLHNHGPGGGWGGCFCRLHLKRFSERVGKDVSREELLDTILRPGRPHPWRRIWREVWKESLIEPAKKLTAALKAVSADIRIGLMTSHPDTHIVEGKDLTEMAGAFGSEPALLIRPHYPPYTQEYSLAHPPSIPRYTIACIEESIPVEAYPELEGSPRCGRYSKNGTYFIWQAINSACFGAAGIAINPYDMMGTGIKLYPDLSSYLHRAKPLLNAIAELKIDERSAEGVRILFNKDIADFIYAEQTGSFQGSSAIWADVMTTSKAIPQKTMMSLENKSIIWADILSTLGISNLMTDKIIEDGTPYAVSDQTLRAFSDEDIKRLLSCPLLLDGTSAQILLERGFGEYIGFRSASIEELYKTPYGYEYISESNKEIYGVSNPRMIAQRSSSKLVRFEDLLDGAEILSWICSPKGKELFAGCILFENPLGGKIVSITYPGRSQFFVTFFNTYRREFLQRLVFRISQRAAVAAAGPQPVFCFRERTRAGIFFGIVNSTLDPYDNITLRLTKGEFSPQDFSILDPTTGSWENAASLIEKSERDLFDEFVINRRLEYLNGIFLLARRKDS